MVLKMIVLYPISIDLSEVIIICPVLHLNYSRMGILVAEKRIAAQRIWHTIFLLLHLIGLLFHCGAPPCPKSPLLV